MRTLVAVTAVVLSAGVAGLSLQHPKAVRANAAAASSEPAPAPILPPGWDPVYLARLTDTAAKPSPASAREGERIALYQRELDNQEQLLLSHDREPIDRAWADGAEAEVRSSVEEADAEPGFAVSRVECREKTCLAEVMFSSPSEALRLRHELSRVAPPSCRGAASVLTPPEADGPYSTQVVYFCR